MDIPSLFSEIRLNPLTLWCHQPHGWLENPRTEWRFLVRTIIDKWSIFQHAMFDYQSVYEENWRCSILCLVVSSTRKYGDRTDMNKSYSIMRYIVVGPTLCDSNPMAELGIPVQVLEKLTDEEQTKPLPSGNLLHSYGKWKITIYVEWTYPL